MSKLRVIDLLNKIANGEEVPKIIKFEGLQYTLHNEDKTYYDSETNSLWNGYCFRILTKEVEIIEEEKKIPEKLDFDISTFNYKEYGIDIMRNNVIANTEAINEIIDYLNSKGE